MQRFLWMIQAAVFYGFTLLAALMPAATIHRAGAGLGLLTARFTRRRAIAMENISNSLPYLKGHPLWAPPCETARELSAATFENLGRSLLEICRLYHGRGEEVIANVEVRGREHYDAAKLKGKGMICLSGHCGNWEVMALAFGRLFGDGVVVAKEQKNPFLNRMVERMRMRYNSRVIYKKGALRGILAALKKGKMVGILADQAVLPEEGVLIDFLGRTAWASKAPLLIARQSGAPLLPVFIHREGERHIITFYPEHIISADRSEEGIKKDIEALSSYVESFVVAHPTQWYWVHRRWKRGDSAVC